MWEGRKLGKRRDQRQEKERKTRENSEAELPRFGPGDSHTSLRAGSE